jgi:hypothetical protein
VTVSPTPPLAVLRLSVARFVHAKAATAVNAMAATAVPKNAVPFFFKFIEFLLS